jgi:SAM-dependent methyltransferase
MEWYKAAFGELYPLVYPHRDVNEAARVASRLAPLVAATRPTLDVACGDGRYMCALAAAGVDIYGVDLSEYLLGDAVTRGLAGRVVCGDMRALPFVSGAFGSAINMFTSFGYFESDAENSRVLAEVERVLASRGAFVIDFINAGLVRRSVKPPSHRVVRGAEVDETRELSDDARVLTKHVRVRWPDREPVEYAERLRLYNREELIDLLRGVGFDVMAEHGDYELGEFVPGASPRLILVCRKRNGEE